MNKINIKDDILFLSNNEMYTEKIKYNCNKLLEI